MTRIYGREGLVMIMMIVEALPVVLVLGTLLVALVGLAVCIARGDVL